MCEWGLTGVPEDPEVLLVFWLKVFEHLDHDNFICTALEGESLSLRNIRISADRQYPYR